MADETEFLEGEGEEGSSLAKVAIIHVESDGNMVMNIEEGEGGGLGRGGFRSVAKGIGAVRSTGAGWADHGQRSSGRRRSKEG
jgi:hypothetical protein